MSSKLHSNYLQSLPIGQNGFANDIQSNALLSMEFRFPYKEQEKRISITGEKLDSGKGSIKISIDNRNESTREISSDMLAHFFLESYEYLGNDPLNEWLAKLTNDVILEKEKGNEL